MANYPTSVFSPTTKSSGDTIAPGHVNDLQAEVTAIETALLTTGLAHNVTITALLAVSGFGSHTFIAGATGAMTLDVRNTTAGTGNSAQFRIGTDLGISQGILAARSSTYTPGSTWDAASGVDLSASGAGGLSIAATDAAGEIRFYTGGNTRRAYISAGGSLISDVGFLMNPWPTTANAANAYVTDGSALARSTSSLRYKSDVVRLDPDHARRVIAALRPITYRGIHDGPTRFAGFAAEEVAEVEPLLVTWDTQARPDYVTYDRIPAYLVPVVQELVEQVAALRRWAGAQGAAVSEE